MQYLSSSDWIVAGSSLLGYLTEVKQALTDLFLHSNCRKEAIGCYDEAIRINPNNDAALYNKGNALSKLGRYEEALGCYNKALEINPEDATPLFNMACVYALQQQKEKMLEKLDKAIQMDNDLKIAAKEEKDFEAYWDDPDFKRIVEE